MISESNATMDTALPLVHNRDNTRGVVQQASFQTEMYMGGGQQSRDKEYAYVVGSINAYFPNLSIEKEFYQACVLSGVDVSELEGIDDEVGLSRLNRSDSLKQTLYKGFSKPENGYVAREMSWVFSNVDGNEIYHLIAESDESLLQFIAALGVEKQSIIMLGQVMAGGHILVSNLIPTKSTPVAQSVSSANEKNAQMLEIVEEIQSLNANDGHRNEDRAINYVLYNNPRIYSESYDLCYKANSSGPNPSGYQLVTVEVMIAWSGDRLVAKVIFNYQGINTGAKQSWYSAIDVTGEYPFMLAEWKRFLPQF